MSALLTRFVLPALLFAFALAVRLLPVNHVALGRRVQFISNDAYYHLRRILYALVHFPESLDFDLYINFPDGARAIWTPHFDWLVAAALWPFSERLTPRAVELLASLAPPIFGAATVVALYFLARRHFGARVALLAGLTLGVMPGHFWYSQFGYIDHHCAVAFVTTLLLFAAMSLVDALSAPSRRAGARLRAALATGALAGLSLLVWPGALLHVGIVEVGLVVLVLGRGQRGEAVTAAGWLGAVNGVAFAVVAPFAIGSSWGQWSDFSPVVLSNFQPWLFAAAALFAAVCVAVWIRLPALAGSRASRVQGAFAIGLAIAGGSLLVWPGLEAGAREAFSWLSKTDDFQALVSESNPLFEVDGRFSVVPAVTYLSVFSLLVPIALAAGALRLRGAARPAAAWLFLAWSAVLFGVTLLQMRFFNSSSVAVSLLLALSVRGVYRIAIQWIRGSADERIRGPGVRVGVATALALGCGALLYPAWNVYAPFLATLGRADGRTLLRGHYYERFALGETAQWIRENTPPTSGWLEPGRQPEYAVVASWDLGHLIQYVARRPTAADNFGDDLGGENFARVQEYFRSPEDRAVAILERLVGRYVVVPHYDDFLGESPGEASMFRALYGRDGSELSPEEVGEESVVPALERHRLVFEFANRSAGPGGPAVFKVFEYVPGARIVGRAAPGADIHASLAIETGAGRRFEYATRARAAADGRYVLRVPYASAKGGPGVNLADSYELRCGAEQAVLRVEERDVAEGRVVRGPELCRAPPEGT